MRRLPIFRVFCVLRVFDIRVECTWVQCGAPAQVEQRLAGRLRCSGEEVPGTPRRLGPKLLSRPSPRAQVGCEVWTSLLQHDIPSMTEEAP